MKSEKKDLLTFLLERYVLDILNILKHSPKRFSDLKKSIKNERTLSLKLSKLLDFGLIEPAPIKIKGRYVNSYMISQKGRDAVKKLERM